VGLGAACSTLFNARAPWCCLLHSLPPALAATFCCRGAEGAFEEDRPFSYAWGDGEDGDGELVGCLFECCPSRRLYGSFVHLLSERADPHEALHVAMDVCPISCIYLVPAEDLALLEYIHASQPRTPIVHNSCESKSGRAKGVEESPFKAAERFKQKLAERLDDRQKEHAAAERGSAIRNAMNTAMNNVVPWPWSRRASREQDDDGNVDVHTSDISSRAGPTCPWSVPRDSNVPLQLPAKSILVHGHSESWH
ncbi:hypothetical protein CYMTET_10826, partial [Cymbomonas tetramitiformis]